MALLTRMGASIQCFPDQLHGIEGAFPGDTAEICFKNPASLKISCDLPLG